MAQVDLTQIAQLTAQLSAVNTQIAAATDPTVKAFLNSQAAVLTQQIQAEATHAQMQVDATNNLLDGLGLFATLNQVLAGASSQIPSILSLFKK